MQQGKPEGRVGHDAVMLAPYSQVPQMIAHIYAQANVCQNPVSCVEPGEGTWSVQVKVVVPSACFLLACGAT